MKKAILLLLTLTTLFGAKIEFEVLGSGGPEIDGRASTSYLLWVDDEAKLIVDMGSGSMLRFEQSHARLESLEAVVLTHMHIDHSVDLASFMKAGYFSSRRESLDVIGPEGNRYFPSMKEFVERLFGSDGAYEYMQDILEDDSDSFTLKAIDIEKKTTRVYKDFTLTMTPVHHGNVPAIAVRIDVDGKSILISGDTNNKNHSLEKLAYEVDLFVAHHAIPKFAKGYATQLHMKPTEIANIAQKSHVKSVLLTHRMKRTLGNEKETLEIIGKIYKGKVSFAEDRTRVKL